MGPDEALYIVDWGNGAVRKLADGTVSTVVGNPDPPADRKPVDGDAETARLVRPMSLAFDAKGVLWIADFGGGLRRFEHGKLTTVKLEPAATSAPFRCSRTTERS